MANKFLDQNGLLYFWQKIVNKFVAKETGKGLSTNDFTNELKTKLDGVADGANKTTVEDVLTSTSSTNALSANQGKVLDGKIQDLSESMGNLGYGDMLKTKYDTDNNGKVDNADNADKLGGQPSSYYAKASDILSKFSDLTNDGAVQYTAQTLTDEQKSQARANIGAGTSNFDGDYNKLTNIPTNFAPATHTHEMSDVNGLNDALNGKSDSNHKHTTSDITDFSTEMAKKVDASIVGQANGVATLDGTGLIPSTQLPSYVDDVVEGYAKTSTSDSGVVTVDGFYKEAEFTTAITGETGKIYVDLATNISYRWGGTTYVQITSSDMTAITNAEIDTIVAS